MADIAKWVRRSQQGDNHAFARLVDLFQDMAYGYAYALLGDFHLAEDATQEAFVECFRCLHQLKDPRRFRAGYGG
jgi:DNA-directed RNA polymerase specialized sigma24 family protein